MRRLGFFSMLFALPLVVALLGLGGCSSETETITGGGGSSPSADEQTIDLNDEYGGYLPVDEVPAFGDEQLAQNDEEQFEDGYEGLSEQERARARDLESRPNRRWFSLTVLWGNLENMERTSVSPDTTEPTNWEGHMEVSENGAIKLLSMINFEPQDGDHILPRVDRMHLDWEAITRGYFDGLRVLLIFAAEEDSVLEGELHLSLAADGQTVEWTLDLDELAEMEEMVDVPGTDLKVSVRSFEADPAIDVRGFCGGRWGWAEGDSVGRFAGRWVSASGLLLGHMAGIYGENDQGEKVFFGKYIDLNGRFKGFIRGHYDIIEGGGDAGATQDREVGWFSGEWVGAHGEAIGPVKGLWTCRSGRPGWFSGMWWGNHLGPGY